jgi:two-component system chemotaxis response regulator CheB
MTDEVGGLGGERAPLAPPARPSAAAEEAMQSANIRVLVVDDSAFMRTMLKGALGQTAGIEVIATACDGADALKKAFELRPDVMTLDVEMPGLNGLAVLDEVMRRQPTPIVMVSTKTQQGAAITLDALRRGAVAYVAKPLGGATLEDFRHDVVAAVLSAAASNRKLLKPSSAPVASGRRAAVAPLPGLAGVPLDSIVAIGISAGGPQTLHRLLPKLPARFPPVLITLHMTAGFTQPFARRLNEECALTVQEARAGDDIRPGVVYIAPGGQHMTVEPTAGGLRIGLNSGDKISGFRPSVDALFNSLAVACPQKTVAIVMTGMGFDGAAGLKELKRLGARTLAQDQHSSIVYGMPKAAVETGCVDRVVALEDIPAALADMLRRAPTKPAAVHP